MFKIAAVTKTRTYSSGDVLTADYYNSDRDEIISGVNSIVNAQISASAAIAASKISGTAVTLAGTETLTNKTLTSPTVNTPTITGPTLTVTTDTDGSTVTFDLDAGPIHSVTLEGNRKLAVSNSEAGKVFVVHLIQDGSGSRTVTFWSTIKWAGGTAPTLTTTAGKADTLGFICISTGNYLGYVVGQNL